MPKDSENVISLYCIFLAGNPDKFEDMLEYIFLTILKRFKKYELSSILLSLVCKYLKMKSLHSKYLTAGLVLVILLIHSLSFAQKSNKIDITILKDLSFEELTILEEGTDIENDLVELHSILDFHIEKAKLESNDYELLSVYDWRIWSEPMERAKLYSDSAIRISYKLKDPFARAESLISYGTYLYLKDQASSALKTTLTSYYLSDSLEFKEGMVNSLNIISGIQREYGQEYKALQSQLKSLEILESSPNEFENYEETLLFTLDATSKCNLHVGEIESALSYAYRGKKLAKELKDKSFSNSYDIIIGQAFYYSQSYKNAVEILSSIQADNNDLTLGDIYFYLGASELKLHNIKNGLNYFKKVDSILAQNEYPIIDNVEILYQELLNFAIENNNRSREKEYLNRLIYYDSLMKGIDLEVEKISLINFDLRNDRVKSSSTSSFITVIALVLFCGFTVFAIRLQRSSKYQVNEPLIRSASNQIPLSIKNRLLAELKDWEDNKGFLDQDISQVELASKLGTNSSYLSRLINENFNISYSKYIKDLRTSYMVADLESNHKELRRKSMIQLAEMYGFKSQDSFVRAYKEKTGLTPSAFLKNKRAI